MDDGSRAIRCRECNRYLGIEFTTQPLRPCPTPDVCGAAEAKSGAPVDLPNKSGVPVNLPNKAMPTYTLDRAIWRLLLSGGYSSGAKVAEATDEQLLAVKGIGQEKLGKIRVAFPRLEDFKAALSASGQDDA